MNLFAPQPNNELFKITEVKAFTNKRITKNHPLQNIMKHLVGEYPDADIKVIFSEDNFNEPNQTIYAYPASDGEVYITKSLKNFSGEYKTLKGWGIKRWKKVI